MSSDLNYDPKSAASIESYALRLLNRSLRDVFPFATQTFSGKGRLGQILESLYFCYQPNSNSAPDFEEAGVELKTSPLVETNGDLAPKERLVFSIINYNDIVSEDFEGSSFWKKNQRLLLMFFVYESGVSELDFKFKIIRLWEFPDCDVKIIKDDWEKIVRKIKAGEAHEISEGDTFYLGACTKGANRSSLRKQPFSDEPAMQRAFSLKQKYLSLIIQESSLSRDRHRSPAVSLSRNVAPAVKDLSDYEPGQTFEDLVISRFSQFYGMSEVELVKTLGLPQTNAKNRYYSIAKKILGVSGNKIEEFEKGEVVLKTIRLEESGRLKESMSFAQIQFESIINEEWEDSYLHDTLTKRFFFVIFQKDNAQQLRLKRVMFWTMPYRDLQVAKGFWEDTKSRIINDDHENFLKVSNDRILHVRPKAKDNNDLMRTPSGRMEKKKSYWLNASYILSTIDSKADQTASLF